MQILATTNTEIKQAHTDNPLTELSQRMINMGTKQAHIEQLPMEQPQVMTNMETVQEHLDEPQAE